MCKNSQEFKASKYNISRSEGAGEYVVVNTLTTAAVRLRESPPRLLSALLDSEAPFELAIENELLELLVKNGFLVPKDFNELGWLEQLHTKARVGSEALGIGITLTLACNFRCTYCYQKHDAIHLSRDLEDAIVKYVAQNIGGRSRLRVSWFGGEPLLRLSTILRLSPRLIDLARDHNTDYEADITTNGFLLTRENAQALSKVGVSSVQVTLDGPAEVHDERRMLANGDPTFQTILSNIQDTAELFRQMIIRVNIDKRNQKEIIKLLNLLAPVKEKIELAFRPANSPDSPTGWEPWCLEPSEYSKLERELKDTMHVLGFNFLGGYAIPSTSFCSGYQQNSVMVDPYGDIHKCPVCVGRRSMRYGVLNSRGEIVFEDGFQREWDKWSPFLDDECRKCKALPVCMGGCLWYLGKEKANSFRCFAKNGLSKNLIRDAEFNRISCEENKIN